MPTKEKTAEIFKQYGGSETNTGSVESQVALFSHRIAHITEHLKQNKNDHSSTTALLKMVGQRRKLLKYLSKKDINRYRSLISELGLRR